MLFRGSGGASDHSVNLEKPTFSSFEVWGFRGFGFRTRLAESKDVFPGPHYLPGGLCEGTFM